MNMAMSSGPSSLRGCVEEISTCPVCLDEFTNPRSLPCIHTFCLRCLEGHLKDMRPGDGVPCPLCRKEFRIPEHGLSELPHNFLVQCLIDAKEAEFSQPCDADRTCDVCRSEKSGDWQEATVYCVNCSQKLCERCSIPHAKMLLGGEHRIQPLGKTMEALAATTQPAARQVFDSLHCVEHQAEVIKLYCFDCGANICLMCFAVDHIGHDCQEISKVVEGLVEQIDRDLESISARRCGLRDKAGQMEAEKNKFLDTIGDLEAAVQRTAVTVQSVIDNEVAELVGELQTMKSDVVKEVGSRTERCSVGLVALERFGVYCGELKTQGRPGDITRTAKDLHNRAGELLHTFEIPADFSAPSVTFIPVCHDSCLAENAHKFVGRLQRKTTQASDIHDLTSVDDAVQQQRVDHQSADQWNHAKEQSHEHQPIVEEEEQKQRPESSGTPDNSKKQTQQSPICAQAELKAAEENVKRLYDELKLTQKMLHELTEKEEISRGKLEKKVRSEEQSTDTCGMEDNLCGGLQEELDRLKQEMDELQEELRKEKLVSNVLQKESKLNRELLIEHTSTVARVIHKFPTAGSVCGVTSVDNELFVLCRRDKDQVEVYETTDYSLQRCLTVPGLTGLAMRDMASCGHHRCLYITDSSNKCISRLELNGKVTKWTVKGKVCGLSVTTAHNVLVTCTGIRKLKEISTLGKQLRVINLQSDMVNPWHAVQLSSGQFVVCHGQYDDSVHRVCMVDCDGQVAQSYGGFRGSASGQLNVPFRVAVDTDGFVFVADYYNDRVLLLSPSLNYVRDVVSRDHALSCPHRLYLDTDTRRLYVGQFSNELIVIGL